MRTHTRAFTKGHDDRLTLTRVRDEVESRKAEERERDKIGEAYI